MTRARATLFLLPLSCLCVLSACSDSEARERLRQNAAATWDSAVEVTAEAMGQAQDEAERLLADLEVQRVELRERVAKLEHEGAQAWQRMLREAQGELDDLSRRLD